MDKLDILQALIILNSLQFYLHIIFIIVQQYIMNDGARKGVPVLESFEYKNVCVIKLIKKAFKYLVYECHFYDTQQTAFVKLLDNHQTSFYIPACLQNAKICTKNQCQTVQFWYLSNLLPEIKLQQYYGRLANISNASHINHQKMQTKHKEMNYNQQQSRLIRFIFQCALNKLQLTVEKKKQDTQNKELSYYFLAADGILFNNIIVYTKPIEISLKNGYKINDEQKKILIERLKSIHAKNISYINLSSSCIAYTTVCTSNEKEQKERRKLTPILKINNHLQPFKFDFNDQVFNYEIQTLQQILHNSIQVAQTNIGHLEKRWASQNLYCFTSQSQSQAKKQKNVNIQHELIKMQKLLQVPRIYLAMQQINTAKFETTLKQIKKNITNEQYLWCLSKYQQINLLKQYQNMNIRIQPVAKTNGINNLSLISNNSNTSGNISIQNNFIENLSLYCNNGQTSLLLKEFKNLDEERYFPNRESESMLGWGEIALRYHYNTKNSSHQIYIKMLQKYLKQLEKYKNYKKIRKFYLFYSSKLLLQKNRINQSIFHMKQCYNLVKKNQCLSENDQKNNLQEEGIICHELGRLYTEIKRYDEALQWFNRSLHLKDKIYGRYSVQMLSTLYNIIYILLTFDTRQMKGVGIEEYIKIISQIKHHMPIEAVFNKWMDNMIIKQSISFINKMEQKIACMHTNPWQKYQEKAFVAKLSKNKSDLIQCNDEHDYQEISFTNQNKLVLHFFIHVRDAERRRKDQSVDLDGLKKCRQKLSELLEDKRLQKNYQKINIIKLKLIKTYTNKKIIDAQKLEILNYLIRFVQCIKQLKILVRQLQTNNGNSDASAKNQLCSSLRQLVYRWSKLFISMVNTIEDKSSFRDEIQRSWQWILKQYYQEKLHEKSASNNQNNNSQRISKKYIQSLMYSTSIYNKLKLYHITDILQYCLLLYVFYRDYGHIFNILVYILQKNNGQGEIEYKNNINIDKVIDSLSKYDYNQMMIIAYILSICMIHMHRFTQSESILEFIIPHISSINKNKKINQQKRAHNNLCQLLPKQNIYCYQFEYMLLYTYYATHSYHKFIQLFQSISLTQGEHVMSRTSINKIVLAETNYMINLAFHVYYLVFNQSQDNSHLLSLIHKFVRSPFHQNRCEYLYIDTYHMVIKILYKLFNKDNAAKEQLSLFISCIRNIFINGINCLTYKPDKHINNSFVNQYGILHLFYQSAEHKDECNLVSLFCQSIKMMINMQKSQNVKKFVLHEQLIHQIDQLIYQLLCPFFRNEQNQMTSPKVKQYIDNFNQILRMEELNKKKSQSEEKEMDVKVEQLIIQKLSKQIIEYIKMLVNKHKQGEQDIKLKTVVVNWLPQITESVQKKNKPQINEIISILFNWCRFNSMLQQTILCAIWLQIYGNTNHIKHVHDEHTIKRQYQQVVNMLKMRKQTQIQQNKMQIFRETGIQKYIKEALTKFNKIKQQFEQFIQEYNSLMQWSTESFEYDIDNYINIVQKLLNKLEIIKFNLSVTIPSFYMTHLLHHLINPIIASLNEL